MSRVSNALNMYMLLQGRRLIKVKEIAEILEVSPRMVKEYKKDLEKAGIFVGSKRGRYGGYYLENSIDLKGLKISKEELEALKMASENIVSGNHVFAINFERLANKILNSQNDFEHTDYFIKDNLKPMYMRYKEREKWNVIRKAMINKRKIEISYKSLGNGEKEENSTIRVIHPYGTFDYDGASYFFGYCELRKGIRYFKIIRIEDIKILNNKFVINIDYDIKKMLRKSFGIIDDDIFYLKLKIHYPMSQLVREKQYSINQKITKIDEETIIFEAELKGYPEVKSWILSMGSKVEVLEPKKLKKDIAKEIDKLQQIYL